MRLATQWRCLQLFFLQERFYLTVSRDWAGCQLRKADRMVSGDVTSKRARLKDAAAVHYGSERFLWSERSL